jgi:hypothetical protein
MERLQVLWAALVGYLTLVSKYGVASKAEADELLEKIAQVIPSEEQPTP